MNGAIHAAVRRDLDRLERALRRVEDGDRARVAQLARAWDNLHDQLVEHHEKEDELVWPALQGLGVDAALLGEMENEHADMRAALEATDERIRALEASGTRSDAVAAADSIVAAREVVERHLSHEEQELEPRMLELQETPEWKAVEKQLRAGGPVRGGWMFAWLLDGASTEVSGYLRSRIPAPVLLLLSRGFGVGYQRRIAPVWRT